MTEPIPHPPLRVRAAQRDDVPTLVAFNQHMANETEGRVLDGAVLTRGVQAVFDDPARGFYLVAERDGERVGQLMVTYEHSDWRDGTFFWVQSVYVLASARRSGVYRALYDEVLAIARRRGDVCGVRLYVERDNDVAQSVYRALGMEPTIYQMFEVELPRP